MKEKIIFVITGLGLGGAEKQLCLLADEMTQRGHDVLIISLNGEVIVTPNNKNIKIVKLNMRKNFSGLIAAIFKLSKIITNFNPEIVHAHMFHANVIARLAKLITPKKIKLVCTAHSKNEGGLARMLVYRFTDFLCDITTNVSNEALEAFIEQKAFKKSKSLAVYNGIDTHYFNYNATIRQVVRDKLKIDDSSILILSVGRLTEAKDYPNLLNAVKILPEKYKLVIIGEGVERHNIEKLIVDLHLEQRVKLLGGIMDVVDYYSACDIYVSSSRWEGFGLVVAEAMSCQRLVTATDAGGVAEVVGDSNFIVPISDSKMLAEKITDIMSYNETLKTHIMHRNREHIINVFSIDSIVDKWFEVYSFNQA